jgi:uncharacterized protein (DUF3820 family)
MEDVNPSDFQPDLLLSIVQTPMPFGKYKGRLISELPMYYLEWFRNKGFPKNKLGRMLETTYEIRLNGLDHILVALRKSIA